MLAWYFKDAKPNFERLPFYCDPQRIGVFAVAPDALALGDDATVFSLFVTLAMYQALRDVVIMGHQRSISRSAMRVVADVRHVKRAISIHQCPMFGSPSSFEDGCDVSKSGRSADCSPFPGARCHVKDATVVFNRMGDMGKLPSSAWLHIWKQGGVRAVLADICSKESSPTRRAELLVERFARVHRVGRKLSTLFVSVLSTPALAPGLTPWFPTINGSELVVVDTNVARAVDALREPSAMKTYGAREQWLRTMSAGIDLREFCSDLPQYSPRIVQEAIYAFCSKSNRFARGDPCGVRANRCANCVPILCPFCGNSDPND